MASIASFGVSAGAAVTSASADAEATVYLPGDYAKPFDVIYDARLEPQPKNRAWWVLDVMLVGLSGPGTASIGIERDTGKSALTVYTSARIGTGPSSFVRVPGACKDACRIELRGDTRTVEVLFGGRVVRRWSRASLAIVKPYIQLNAEASGRHDRLAGDLTPVLARVDGVPVAPSCAFTTRGVAPYADPDGKIWFDGHWSEKASVTYIDLKTGKEGDTCAGGDETGR